MCCWSRCYGIGVSNTYLCCCLYHSRKLARTTAIDRASLRVNIIVTGPTQDVLELAKKFFIFAESHLPKCGRHSVSSPATEWVPHTSPVPVSPKPMPNFLRRWGKWELILFLFAFSCFFLFHTFLKKVSKTFPPAWHKPMYWVDKWNQTCLKPWKSMKK